MSPLALIGRLIVIALALFVAGLTAMAVIGAGIWQAVDLGSSDPNADPVGWAFAAVMVASVAIKAISALILAPAAVAIVISEAFGLRSWMYHAAAGAIAAALPLVMRPELKAATNGPDGFTISLYLAAGLAGGLVYWLLAGRDAGRFMGRDQRSLDSNR